IFIDGRYVLRRVMPFASGIGEPQVHIFHGVLGEPLQHFAHAGGRVACRLLRHACYSPSFVLAAARDSTHGSCVSARLVAGPHHAGSVGRPSTRFRQGPKAVIASVARFDVIQMASSPRSPVRIRITSSTEEMKIFPSPIRPVRAELTIASTARSTILSSQTTSIFTLGRKSTTYSAPRYSSVCPF